MSKLEAKGTHMADVKKKRPPDEGFTLSNGEAPFNMLQQIGSETVAVGPGAD